MKNSVDECALGQHLTETGAGIGTRKNSFDRKIKTALEAGSSGNRVLDRPGPMGTPAREKYRERSRQIVDAEEAGHPVCGHHLRG
ncbi:MAG TPA: hypothetical protein DF613_10495 [Lachnospiraceae bacterium]|nr:hypothetical protein [Lachnospiraceae bacterium]